MPAPYTSPVLSYTTKTNKVDLVDASHINSLQTEQIAQNNRLLNTIDSDGSLLSGASFPSPALTSQAFWRTDEKKLYIFDGSWTLQAAALTLVSSTTVTASTNSGDITMDSTKQYLIKIIQTSAGTGDTWCVRFNNASGANTYGYVTRAFDFAAAATNTNSNMASTLINTGVNTIAAGSSQIFSYMYFYIDPQATGGTKNLYIKGEGFGGVVATGTTTGMVDFVGAWSDSTTATSFRVLTVTNTWTGKVLLYEIGQS